MTAGVGLTTSDMALIISDARSPLSCRDWTSCSITTASSGVGCVARVSSSISLHQSSHQMTLRCSLYGSDSTALARLIMGYDILVLDTGRARDTPAVLMWRSAVHTTRLLPSFTVLMLCSQQSSGLGVESLQTTVCAADTLCSWCSWRLTLCFALFAFSGLCL